MIGPDTELYVDANGGYQRKQAVRMARAMAGWDVRWFEEPVSSDDLDGLREVRDRAEADVTAGEYGTDVTYFRRMCAARRGGLPADRRHPLRRLHRMAPFGGGGGEFRADGVRPLRAEPACSGRRCHPEPAAPGMVPRPRAHRVACCSTAPSTRPVGTITPGTGPAWPRHGADRGRRRPLPGPRRDRPGLAGLPAARAARVRAAGRRRTRRAVRTARRPGVAVRTGLGRRRRTVHFGRWWRERIRSARWTTPCGAATTSRAR